MLRKTRKLNLSWTENQQFFREFSIFRSPSLTIYYRTSSLPSQPKLSVVVGKRISNLATVRNKSKRLLYSLAQEIDLKNLNKDIVIVLTKTQEPRSYQVILKQFARKHS